VLSDTGSDQGRGFETADEFNQRLNDAAGQVTDGPDSTVVLPVSVQRRNARVHFDDEQVEAVETVNTGQQGVPETNSHFESSEELTSEDDILEGMKYQLAMKHYQAKVLKELLAIKERELAELSFVTGS